MAKQDKPHWEVSYEKTQDAKRERILRLVRSSPSYPRPPRDPSLVPTSVNGKIAVRNAANGDTLAGHSNSYELEALTFAFRIKSGELVSFYRIQLVSGYPEKLDFVPYRIFAITHNASPTVEGLAARARMSPEIFARYLASSADYVDDPAKKFVVIDAPLEIDETLQ